MRSLVVEDRVEGEVELDWRDLDRVDFMPSPGTAQPTGRRLYGTLLTPGWAELTGFVAWDLDEVFDTDVLDGQSVHDREDYEIEFGEIAAIEYDSRSSARVLLVDGTELVLRGTNDVDRSNRGIEISDPGFGRAVVPWEELEVLTFHEQRAASGGYADFPYTGPVRGAVEARDGTTHVGQIRWDNDEAFAWEVLDGDMDGVTYDIELGRIASIARHESCGVTVTVLDGRVFELRGSNDVDAQNRGCS